MNGTVTRLTAALTLVAAMMPLAACTTGQSTDPFTTYSVSVRLKDGRVVDCVTMGGIDCDWRHPRDAKDGETPKNAKYFTLKDGRTVPCLSQSDRYINGVSCDFGQ